MHVVKPEAIIQNPQDAISLYKAIELAGRTCYKSFDRITDDSAEDFIRRIKLLGHLSVLEHQSLTVRFICDRGVSHELVRHRIASFSQESTRYCDYQGKEIEFVIPVSLIEIYDAEEKDKWWMSNEIAFEWSSSMFKAEESYKKLRSLGWTPQQARSVLPNSLKTEIVMTANIREWLLVESLRTAPNAHPDMLYIMRDLFGQLHKLYPVIFTKGE